MEDHGLAVTKTVGGLRQGQIATQRNQS
jgi:hypothetical protein